MFAGKQKTWTAALFAALIAGLQILATNASYTPWTTGVLAVLSVFAVYLVPNKPYRNP
jgi:hypothetical protein